MAFDYAPIRDIAVDVIAEFGTTVAVHSTTNTYVPGQPPGETVTTQTGLGVLQPLDVKDRPDSLVEATAQSLLLAPQGITTPPEPGDRVSIAGLDYTVVSVTTERPATTTLYYDLTVTR